MRPAWMLVALLALCGSARAAEFVDPPDAPSSFSSRIEARAYDDRFATVEDVLDHTVGVSVRRFGGLGTHSTATIRGSRAEQVLVLLDGVRLNSAARGEVDLSTIPLRSVEHIDVLRGAGSARYGTDAIGGVISITSRRGAPQPGADASFTAGRYDTLGADLLVSLGDDRVQSSLVYSRLRSDNDFEFDESARETEVSAPGRRSNPVEPTITRRNADFVQDSGLLTLSFQATPTSELSGTLNLFSRDNGQPGSTVGRAKRNATDRTLNGLRADEQRRRALLALRWRESRESFGFEASIFHRYDRYVLNDHGDPDFDFVDARLVGGNRLQFIDQQSGVDLALLTSPLELGPFTFQNRSAATLRRDHVRSDLMESRDRWIVNLFVQQEISLADGVLRLFPALGYEVAHTGSGSLRRTLGAAPVDVDVDDATDDGVWLPRIGAILRLGPGLRLKSNYLRALRRPNFNELFLPDGELARGEVLLRPEESWNFDVGLEYARPDAGPLSALRVETSWFHRDLDEAIEWVLFDETFIPRNTGRARVQGLEASGSMTLAERLDLALRYTWLDSEIRASDTPLPHAPRNQLFASAALRLPATRLWAELSYEDETYREPTGLIRVPAVTQIDVGVALRPHELRGLSWVPEGIGLSFEARNLTRQQRVDSQGLPLPGSVLWYARVRVELR